MLVHFKVETCSSIDPVDVARVVFDMNRYLVVLHKGKNENPHWHFQGDTTWASSRLDEYLAELAANHTKKIAKPNSRPIKRAKKGIDEVGFQYMMKETPPTVVSTTFTEAELEELHAASEEHVDEMKNKLYHYLEERLDMSKTPAQVHAQARLLSGVYYLDENKMPPSNLQKLILWHIAKLAGKENEVFVSYVFERI